MRPTTLSARVKKLRLQHTASRLDTRAVAPEFWQNNINLRYGVIMQYSKLGKTGMSVSRICLGCMSYGAKKWRDWVLEMDEAREHFSAALESGINFFDTANVYSVGVIEEITGRWR